MQGGVEKNGVEGGKPCIAHALVRCILAVLQPEDRWAVVAAVGSRLVGDRGLLLGDDVRVGSSAARTGRSLRDDAEVVVDVEERRVAAEVAAQQGAVDVVLSCVQVGDDRRVDV